MKRLIDRVDVDEASLAAPVLVADDARDFGKQGVVAAAADVQAGLDGRAALADEDGAPRHELAVEAFAAEALAVAVASVLGAAACFFMGHNKLLSRA